MELDGPQTEVVLACRLTDLQVAELAEYFRSIKVRGAPYRCCGCTAFQGACVSVSVAVFSFFLPAGCRDARGWRPPSHEERGLEFVVGSAAP